MRKLLTGGWSVAIFFVAVVIDPSSGAEGRHRTDWVDGESLSLRRHYNAVAAAVDTIMRQLGRDRVDELTNESAPRNLLPDDAQLVLLFWADDEAELFLNGTPVSATRLIPTRVEIPEFYLRKNNLFQAHCWDTDRVESGFMAGLYVEWSDGGLSPVVTTREGSWKRGKGARGNQMAEEIFYTHAQPDIPEAKVVWGEKLFGEIWLSARFSAEDVRAAGRRGAAVPGLPPTWGKEQPMDFHVAISRLVHLQQERRRLAQALEQRHTWVEPYLRFRGSHRSPIAFSLGRSEPLSEEPENVVASARLEKWVMQLPQNDRELVLRPARQLKGVSAATPQEFALRSGKGGKDRRLDYQPPRDLGPQGSRPVAMPPAEGALGIGREEPDARLWLVFSMLAVYTGAASHRWWKLFRAESSSKEAGVWNSS